MSKRGMRKRSSWAMEMVSLAGSGGVMAWVFGSRGSSDLFGASALILLLVIAVRIAWVGCREKVWETVQMRRREGRCMKCGYDIKGEFERGCPECGWRREANGAEPS